MKKNKITKKDKCLIVGLGNIDFITDSVGPKVLDKIIIKNNKYKIVPSVTTKTNIETFDIINEIVKKYKIDYIILIDSTKTNNIKDINNTIEINDYGFKPGGALNNKRKEISRETLNVPVIAIGVSTIMIIKENYILTSINVDEEINELTNIISNIINKIINWQFFYNL